MSARRQRIEVITRGERQRRWSIEQKREIAAESLEPSISPITVACRYGITSGWRRHLLERSFEATAQPGARFARVEVVAMPTDLAQATPPTPNVTTTSVALSHTDGATEIALPDGVIVRVNPRVDSGAPRLVLAALARRC